MSLLRFDETKCRRDGICVAVCPVGIIELEDSSPVPAMVRDAELGCITCGHCVAACPHGAVSHVSIKPDGCPPVRPELGLSPDHVEHFLRSRRSVRVYQQREVDRDTLAGLIRIARYAPTGHNAQRVKWIVVNSRPKVREMAGMAVDLMRSIVEEGCPSPLPANALVKAWDAGVDLVARDAPALVVAYAPNEDAVTSIDPAIALSFLDLAAPSFGLGACWGGFFMTAIPQWAPLCQALGLPEGDMAFGVMLVGYPAYQYHRLPSRREPRITWHE